MGYVPECRWHSERPISSGRNRFAVDTISRLPKVAADGNLGLSAGMPLAFEALVGRDIGLEFLKEYAPQCAQRLTQIGNETRFISCRGARVASQGREHSLTAPSAICYAKGVPPHSPRLPLRLPWVTAPTGQPRSGLRPVGKRMPSYVVLSRNIQLSPNQIKGF